ncbi:hypothetical protein IL252_09075 [Halomicrobium sp. IBSBa]|uniref:hypothetical protein n=1 Tax=Halomicrobium sp. IBSBa TaxID=2778916 RepID=UPI001ABFC1D7|nr:hypothetical protein [Halomicrobium sp. IBSBa]MBO4247965.1 hypothetical protein [Halomicrobium sp. IBSBa]
MVDTVKSVVGKLSERVELKDVIIIPAVALVLYLTTGDVFTSVIGPAVVMLVFLTFAAVDVTNNDIRYVELAIFVAGIAGGVIMYSSTDIPAWFGVLVTLVSLWWAGTSLVDILRRNRGAP